MKSRTLVLRLGSIILLSVLLLMTLMVAPVQHAAAKTTKTISIRSHFKISTEFSAHSTSYKEFLYAS
jgi:hypothetical protein